MAGDGVAFALCHGVRDAGLPQPSQAVLSPWMHVALPDPDPPAVDKIDLDDLRAAGIRYGSDPLDTPLVSPSVGRVTAEGLDIGRHELARGVHVWMFLPGRHGRAALAEIRAVLSR